MDDESKKVFALLEKVDALSNWRSDKGIFYWDKEKYGNLNTWELLKNQKILFDKVCRSRMSARGPKNQLAHAFDYWKSIEAWGVPYSMTPGEEYAPYRRERNESWDSFTREKRSKYYDALEYFIQHYLSGVSVYRLSSPDPGYCESSFSVYLILAKTSSSDWVCLTARVPDQVSQDDYFKKDVAYYNSSDRLIYPSVICTSIDLKSIEIATKINKILGTLKPIKIYGYYYGGYNYTYNHRLFCAISPSKSKAVFLCMRASDLLKYTVTRNINGDNSKSGFWRSRKGLTIQEQEGLEILQQNLEGTRRFTFSFWTEGITYNFGKTSQGNWVGFTDSFEFEYNP